MGSPKEMLPPVESITQLSSDVLQEVRHLKSMPDCEQNAQLRYSDCTVLGSKGQPNASERTWKDLH